MPHFPRFRALALFRRRSPERIQGSSLPASENLHKRGLCGYPVATVALYGPDDTRATTLTVGIVPAEDADATHLRRWFAEGADIRNDAGVTEEVLAFIDASGARSIVMTERIIGCPHEEGIDYDCPACPFWAARDRWTGKRLH